MIVVTGGAGFIGSNLVDALNKNNFNEVLIVEELDSHKEKFSNLKDLKYTDCVSKESFLDEIKNSNKSFVKNIDYIFHLGACSKTTEKDRDYVISTNFIYSKKILEFCANSQINLTYASSASVYGSGTNFKENPENESFMNYYAESKLMFDQYFRENQSKIQSQVVGLRYFNVFGPREHHKKVMSSVIFHFFKQMENENKIKLFKGSHGYNDGEQRRDFIFVKDTIDVKLWFMNNTNISGIYNVGTGKSRTFNDVASAVISYFKNGEIEYIDFPPDLKNQYQSFTEADITNLRTVGYKEKFTNLENGVLQYLDWLSNQNI